MARKRFVSPKFFTHGELYDAEVSSGLPLRLGFEALWCQADRRGLFAWRPRELKLQCLPYDPCDFADVLDALERHGFVRSYVVDGRKYGFIETLVSHQSFHLAEKPDPTIPAPPPGAFDAKPEPAPPLHGANTVPTPPKPEACSTVAVAVAVTGSITNTAAAAVGDSAPGQQPVRPIGEPNARGAPSKPRTALVGPMFQQQYDELATAALPHQHAALDALLKASPLPDVLVSSIHAIATGMHEVVSKSGEKATIEHVLIALPEAALKFFGDGRAFDQRLFRGCVKDVANRKPELTTADLKASEERLRQAAPALRIERPRTPEEQVAADDARRESMRKFYLEAGRLDKAKEYERPSPQNSAAA